MKFGFELEAFIKNAPKSQEDPVDFVLVPQGLPYDECGWLVEVRSEPHSNLLKAIALLKVERDIVVGHAERLGYNLLFEPLAKISRDLKVKAGRLRGKGLIQYRNVYGFETHRCSTEFATASLHISFTEEKEFRYYDRNYNVSGSFIKDNTESKVFKYQGSVDHARIIVGLDQAFKTEIKKAKRNPGFYEIKEDGRIEYRSLPNDVDLDKVGEVLGDLVG